MNHPPDFYDPTEGPDGGLAKQLILDRRKYIYDVDSSSNRVAKREQGIPGLYSYQVMYPDCYVLVYSAILRSTFESIPRWHADVCSI